MPLLSVDGACLAFGHVALLDHCQLQIDAGERIGLIGRNGTGKSSLLKALAGMAHLDDGEIWRATGLRVHYVAQEPEFGGATTAFEAVTDGLGTLAADLRHYHELSQKVGAGETALLDDLHEVQSRLEAGDGWTLHARVDQAISRLDIDGDASLSTLSGGARKRVALAQAIVGQPDLLLLDEPTNHLDVDGILWLEQFLRSAGCTVMFITHDRAFLDNVCTRIVELDRGKLQSFPGSYADYQRQKEQMLHAESLANEQLDKLLAQEEIWIRKGVEARRTRAVGRIARLEALRSARAARREQIDRAAIRLSSGEASGKLVAELEAVSKRFDERTVIDAFSCRILRGDKVGIIGPNGSGKSTLLRLILGEMPPDGGSVRRGTRLSVAYFDQFRSQLDPEAALVDVISPGSDYIEVETGRDRPPVRQHVIGYLGDFLFAPERARSPVKSLSGGERARLLLARLFARPANLLVLDEPTNDLDIETLELLEERLQAYPGTVFLVSHDRAFLDNVVTQTIAYEGQGTWREYVGGYADWVRQRPPAHAAAPVPNKPAAPKVGAGGTAVKPKPAATKLSFKEQRELAQLPDAIAALETEQASLQARLADGRIYQEGTEAVKAAQSRLALVEADVLRLMDRWAELESRA